MRGEQFRNIPEQELLLAVARHGLAEGGQWWEICKATLRGGAEEFCKKVTAW